MIDLILKCRNRPTHRGYQYEVWHGAELLTASFDPELSACRRLLERGITGKARFWTAGAAEASIVVDIERGARTSTAEDQRRGLRFVKYKPFDASLHLPAPAAPHSEIAARAAA